MMPNQNRPVFRNHRRGASNPFNLPLIFNRRVLVSFPRTYFEVEDIRPGEDELPDYMFDIFETAGGGLRLPPVLNRRILQYLSREELLFCNICLERNSLSSAGVLTIPPVLNRKILQYLSGKELLKFSKASKKALWNVEFSHTLMFDAIHEWIEDLRSEQKWTQRETNEHKYRVGNCVRVCDLENGYVVRVTPKFVFYVTETDIFKSQPQVRRIGNDEGVKPMRPYFQSEPMEFVKNWRTWAGLTTEFPYRD